MNKYTYYTSSKKTGFVIDGFDNYDDAIEAIDRYEAADKKADKYLYGMYQVVDEDHNPVRQSIVKQTLPDGSVKFIGSVVARTDYTGDDYAKDHNITEGTVTLEWFN